MFYLLLAHTNAYIFFLNVAKAAADPWYLQQTGKKLVKVRINVCFGVRLKKELILYNVCVVVRV